MIENDRIPVELYIDRFARWGDRLHTVLTPVRQDIDIWAASLDGRPDVVAEQVYQRLDRALEPIRASLGPVDRLLGFSLPQSSGVRSMARNVAYALAARRGQAEQRWLADFCGAAVQAVVRRTKPLREPAREMFRRPMIRVGEVWRDRPEHDRVLAGLGKAMLPDVFRARQPADLLPWFRTADWTLFREAYGVHTVLNAVLAPAVDLGDVLQASRAILVARYYAAAGPAPYRVCWYADDLLVDDQVLAVAESRMVRASIPRGTRVVRLMLRSLGGEPLELPNAIHLAVLQLIPVDGEARPMAPSA
jgi:hypothetical protein